jgi:hypothetical protein
MSPREFWRMQPFEFWWQFDARRPKKTYGPFTEDEYHELYDEMAEHGYLKPRNQKES